MENVICLAIDRLHAGFLGAYGNTWIHTPAIDRLAAESFVFDRMVIDTPNLELQYRSLWRAKHVLCPPIGDKLPPLLSMLEAADWHTALLTDTPEVAALPDAAAFSQCSLIGQSEADRVSSRDALAGTITDADAGTFFAEAIDRISSARDHFFLWLHTRTLGRVWDAPLEYRQQYADEDDPSPSDSAVTPNTHLPENYDPDTLLNYTNAYAGQVTLIDELIAALLEAMAERGLNENTLFMLYSPRSFPMGEHRRVGSCDDALYSELVHAPLLLRFPAGMNLVGRSQSLVMPADLPATILDACGSPVGESGAGRGRSLLPLIHGDTVALFDRAICIGSQNQHTIVTPAWFLRASQEATSAESSHESAASTVDQQWRFELFAKPDDWFEVNNVADRCPDIAEKMAAEFETFSAACRAQQPAELRPLPEELAIGYC